MARRAGTDFRVRASVARRTLAAARFETAAWLPALFIPAGFAPIRRASGAFATPRRPFARTALLAPVSFTALTPFVTALVAPVSFTALTLFVTAFTAPVALTALLAPVSRTDFTPLVEPVALTALTPFVGFVGFTPFIAPVTRTALTMRVGASIASTAGDFIVFFTRGTFGSSEPR